MGKKPEAQDVSVFKSKSTIASTELAQRGQYDIRKRDDIDLEESRDRYVRELDKAEVAVQKALAQKRKVLMALMAFNQGLAMPDKTISKKKDVDLEPKAPKVAKAQDPKRDRTSKAAKARAAKPDLAPEREKKERVEREVLENREGDKEKVPDVEESNADSNLDGGSEASPTDDAGADSRD